MLQAATLFFASFATWMLIEQRFNASEAAIAAFAALGCVLAVARMPGLGRCAFTSAPRIAWLQVSRGAELVNGASSVVRAALGAKIGFRPALVRVKVRLTSAEGFGALASVVGATASAVVVGVDDEGLLVHVNEERAEEMPDLRRWESQLVEILGERVRG
jgi:multisubunit Na+/H+ antiporter MnhE subunit